MRQGTPTTKERFWGKVHIQNATSCWLWLGGRSASGYGFFWFRGRMCQAHRVAWELTKGTIPSVTCVLHSCDTPLCVNPRHLWLGSKRDNANDAVSKGRLQPPRNFGEANGQAKLKDFQVLQIKSLYRKGLTQYAIADHFAVDQSRISRILNARSWTHIPANG